jgi:fatty-acyl-CoA synthase
MKSELNPRETIHERWIKNVENFPHRDAIIYWKACEEPYRWTFSSLLSASVKYILLLREAGLKRGEVCGLIFRHNKDFYPLYIAVSLAGAIPSVLAYPNPRLHPEKFRDGLEGMSQRSGLDWILTELSLKETIAPLVQKKGSSIKGLLFPLDTENEFIPEDKHFPAREGTETINDPLLLQHSSGTTGLQKPVLLSHKAVLKHIYNYSLSIGLNDNDKVINWLPLYHDMGLIAAFHLPLAFGIPSVQIDPFEWVLLPSILPEVIHKERGTICWLPNFAFNMMADKIRTDELEGITLESMRLFINCSEPIRFESYKKFEKRFLPSGLNPRSLAACYAMAETTYAVTQTPLNSQPEIVYADRKELSNGVLKISDSEDSRICVSSGRVIKGCELKIIDEKGNDLQDGFVGEILIKSESMFDGYRNYPEKTSEVLKDNWYYSGDYGFILDDELFVIGRKKDIIIVAGNNIYPEDIEDAVAGVKGVIPGRVVAFGEFDPAIGSEQVSIIAETLLDSENEKRN